MRRKGTKFVDGGRWEDLRPKMWAWVESPAVCDRVCMCVDISSVKSYVYIYLRCLRAIFNVSIVFIPYVYWVYSLYTFSPFTKSPVHLVMDMDICAFTAAYLQCWKILKFRPSLEKKFSFLHFRENFCKKLLFAINSHKFLVNCCKF